MFPLFWHRLNTVEASDLLRLSVYIRTHLIRVADTTVKLPTREHNSLNAPQKNLKSTRQLVVLELKRCVALNKLLSLIWVSVCVCSCVRILRCSCLFAADSINKIANDCNHKDYNNADFNQCKHGNCYCWRDTVRETVACSFRFVELVESSILSSAFSIQWHKRHHD